jgi:hypothetical protein
MAFSLPSTGGVAANYAASFRPVQPVPGFGNVQSDFAEAVLSQIPAQQFAAELSLAKDALDAQQIIKRERIAAENNLDRIKEQKRISKGEMLMGILQAKNAGKRKAGTLLNKEIYEMVMPKPIEWGGQQLPSSQPTASADTRILDLQIEAALEDLERKTKAYYGN